MGKISKAIKLKLQELRIDDIFKEGILKYKGSISKDEIQNDEIRNNSEENINDLNIENNFRRVNDAEVNEDLAVKNSINESNVTDTTEVNNGDSLKEFIGDSKTIEKNNTMMQYFEWYYPCDGSLWNKIKEDSKYLSEIGITALWLPPACKAAQGMNDTGYGLYDLYDLGEFNQKGTIKTKYGTKTEYLEAIKEAHNNNIKIYADVVFNHKGGADDSEIVAARPVDSLNRNEFIGEKRDIRAHTVFNFPGRGDKYSGYKWTAKDFDGVDYDAITREKGIFKFEGKEWERDVDKEFGNYDFLMYADLDMDSPYVVDELKRWGKWYLEETNVDGFRLDAIKHIKFDFFNDWLKTLREKSNKELFAVGEYWTHDVKSLEYYMDRCGNCMNLFDVPLHFNFYSASNSFGKFDMRKLADNTYLKANPYKAVTFVDNHDTQFGQALESWVQPWFKPLAYTFILTRKEGYPCVFYGDYYGIPEMSYERIRDKLDIILKIRADYAYGVQHDYIDHQSIIGWTREGDGIHLNSGLAALITVNLGGEKKMYVGIEHKGEIWIDASNQIFEKVIIDENGFGIFKVLDGSYSIWIKEN